MGQVHVLPVHLVNKIAAGEVIERPASVVKELVENAIDAGATRVEIAIERGGRGLIAVSDDGGGMSAEDLALAFVPHATSKIAGDDDLFAIDTMGFRGEALASIASISHARIRTRRREEPGGWEVEAGGETIGPVRPCGVAPGTTVSVRDLFFNTPARRKFMKSDSTEFGHISEAVARIALPHRHVAFSLSHNGRAALNALATESIERRVADLFGAEAAEGLIAIKGEAGEVVVSGLLGPPAAARATAKWQYFFLNGRYVRDRYLGHALKEAYRGLIDPQRHPVAFVFLDMPPDAVDVNVHPTKIEVRFRDSQTVHSHLLAALRQTLQAAELRPEARLGGAAALGSAELPDDQRRTGLREALAEFFKSQSPFQPKLHFPQAHDRPERVAPAASADPRPGPPPRVEPWGPPAGEPFSPPTPHAAPPAQNRQNAPVPVSAFVAPAVLQVHNCYLVAADAEGLLIIDQHALHERILYDYLVQRITAGRLESQRLLIPATLKVTAAQRAVIDEHGDLLDRLGIEVADFGPDTVAVHRFPSFLEKVDPADFLTDALDKLAEGDPATGGEHLVHGLLDMMACKAAVKAGDALTQDEIAALLAGRESAEKSTACPHGRPTQIRLTLRDLERQFKRV